MKWLLKILFLCGDQLTHRLLTDKSPLIIPSITAAILRPVKPKRHFGTLVDLQSLKWWRQQEVPRPGRSPVTSSLANIPFTWVNAYMESPLRRELPVLSVRSDSSPRKWWRLRKFNADVFVGRSLPSITHWGTYIDCNVMFIFYCLFSRRSDVRVDTGLNKHIWSMGVRNVAKRVRVRLSRRRNEDEEAKEKVSLTDIYESLFSHFAIVGSPISIESL